MHGIMPTDKLTYLCAVMPRKGSETCWYIACIGPDKAAVKSYYDLPWQTYNAIIEFTIPVRCNGYTDDCVPGSVATRATMLTAI